jgi:P pilus assembly chaperone PapD
LPVAGISPTQKGLSVRYEIVNDYGGLQPQDMRLLD